MRTNTARQQRTRRMTAERRHTTWPCYRPGSRSQRGPRRRFRATVAMWQHADAAGLTPAELHALDMALMQGGDPAVLSTTF